MRDHYREIVRGNPRSFRSVVGRDVSADLAAQNRLAWETAFGGAGLWLVGLVGGWWLAGRAIKPIDTISQTATRIADGEVSERIDIADTDNELGQLSRVLNETFDRLESAIQRQREFTADASHELRTPLTVILSETARGLKRERTVDEHREILANCSLAAKRMRGLVESLLLLARQDMGFSEVHHQSVLSTIAAEAIELLMPLAEEKRITITHELQKAELFGDPQALGILCQNLISNAIHHQSSGGEITIRVFIDGVHAIFEIADKGPGIASEHLPRIFDRLLPGRRRTPFEKQPFRPRSGHLPGHRRQPSCRCRSDQ